MDLKKRLAKEIIIQLYDQETAIEAAAHFARTVQQKEVPDEIPEVGCSFSEDAETDISSIIVKTGQADSRSEAVRLIRQGAVTIDGEKITGNLAMIKSGSIIKVGKRRYARVVNTDKI
jgi:tyrosyl-tRNA synthetase